MCMVQWPDLPGEPGEFEQQARAFGCEITHAFLSPTGDLRIVDGFAPPRRRDSEGKVIWDLVEDGQEGDPERFDEP